MADTYMADKYPQGTSDLYVHLGIDQKAAVEAPVPGLPMEENAPAQEPAPETPEAKAPTAAEVPDAEPADKFDLKLIERDSQSNTFTVRVSKFNFASILKNVFPYIAIFAISWITYIVFCTNISFISGIRDFFRKPQQPQAVQASTLPPDQVQAYNAWINSYFYDVSDPSIIDPNNDISGNGLTNYQKFLLNLNPKRKDTVGLGMSDTEALLKNVDPLTGGPITDKEKQVVAQNIDLEAISNKLSLAAANLSPRVAGASTSGDRQQGADVDTAKPAEVEIPAFNVAVPLIWTKSVNDFDADLPNGLVHYPGTPLPGETGTSYISGHSSNYIWVKGKYNNVFAHLDQLKKYDSFTITATDTDGKKVIFHYVVTSMGLFKADDQAQFANIGKSTVALSTCWPVGTSQQRYVVFAQLTQTDISNQ